MLEKKARLKKKKEFDRVWRQGRSSFGGFLGVKAIISDSPASRFGIMVGLKVSKKATERNLVKRRIREAVRFLSPKIKQGFDVVITSLPAIKNKTLAEIKQLLQTELKRLKIINE